MKLSHPSHRSSDGLPVELEDHQPSDNLAAPLKRPADFEETMRPMTGVLMGRATVAPDNTFADTVPWNGVTRRRGLGVYLTIQANSSPADLSVLTAQLSARSWKLLQFGPA